jgi:hypothetical protein
MKKTETEEKQTTSLRKMILDVGLTNARGLVRQHKAAFPSMTPMGQLLVTAGTDAFEAAIAELEK